MPNVLNGIHNIIQNPITQLVTHYKSLISINNVGEALESYVRDMISDSINITDELQRTQNYASTFSYLGNQNNPPDIIIKNGDAIEVKKIQSYNNNLALNSSYPKSKLYSDSSMIIDACRNCEVWSVKDIIYAVGYIEKNTNILKSIYLVYGDCYAADKAVYERFPIVISNAIQSIDNVEFGDTSELARINRVDPLGITDLRVRGMWQIKNPIKVFDYICDYDKRASFQLFCIMQKTKFESFPERDKNVIESIKVKNFSLTDIQIKDPNNPANLIDAKLISYKI